MQEVLPGIFHWTALHEKLKIEVSSYYLVDEGVLIDPMMPAEGIEWFRKHNPPKHILLTNRHHYRHSSALVEEFDCNILCHSSGLREFTKGEQVQPFEFGDKLPGEIEAYEVGAICPDETALLIPQSTGIIAIADGVIRMQDGPLVFVPDFLMGDDPEEVKRGLTASYQKLLALDFDHLLLAHGEPWIEGGKAAMQQFVAEPRSFETT